MIVHIFLFVVKENSTAMEKITPYEILGVSKTIKFSELRRIFRTKILEHKQKKISAIDFRRMCRAYETLSDYEKRNRYDIKNEWISELSIDKYTSQQLAAEPVLIHDFIRHLETANLTQLNKQDPITHHTILYTAARAGNLKAVKFLTEYGAEADLQQRTKSTALHVASFYGHADVVRYLLESGADYRIVNQAGNTPEVEAYTDDVKKVFIEMKQNDYVRIAANEIDWFEQNDLKKHVNTEYFSQRQTLLHCASKKGYFNLVQWLDKKCLANIDLVDSNDNSALHLAAYGGHTNIVEYLLNRGCNSILQNRWGMTAEQEGNRHGQAMINLFESMRKRDKFEMAREGIDWWFYYYFNNPSKNLTDEKGVSLLYYACRYGRYSVTKWLLEHGANINIQMANQSKSTPLHGAKYHGHFEIVELLLESGADVNIKNAYGTTVFNEQVADDVKKSVEKKINDLLEQYKTSIQTEKLLDVHIYDDHVDNDKPVIKVKLAISANHQDLLKIFKSEYKFFSIARRLLIFDTLATTVISAVYRARYGSSRFIDAPIRLIRHKELPTQYQVQLQEESVLKCNYHRILSQNENNTEIQLKYPLTKEKSVQISRLAFTFLKDSITADMNFEVNVIFNPEPEQFRLSQCICIFKTSGHSKSTGEFIESPIVSFLGKNKALLYTFVPNTNYWFNNPSNATRLPQIDGIHAFIRQVDIIPGFLTLPPDLFVARSLDQPLETRNSPVRCRYIKISEQDKRTHPFIAYHGTSIDAIRSILYDGLVIPGTLVSCGKRVCIPPNHIAREVELHGISKFALAVFLSPSIHYSSYGAYAIPFSYEDQQLIPILECSVKANSYKPIPFTSPAYEPCEGEDLNTIEWRVQDPRDISINTVLFITKNSSITASTKTRKAHIS